MTRDDLPRGSLAEAVLDRLCQLIIPVPPPMKLEQRVAVRVRRYARLEEAREVAEGEFEALFGVCAAEWGEGGAVDGEFLLAFVGEVDAFVAFLFVLFREFEKCGVDVDRGLAEAERL